MLFLKPHLLLLENISDVQKDLGKKQAKGAENSFIPSLTATWNSS